MTRFMRTIERAYTRMSPTIELACELIRRPSVTPEDAGCQQLIAERLARLGFRIEHLRFGDVDNLWARLGTATPLVAFAGHTDVVPTGDPQAWSSPPFTPSIRDGQLYGRGAADMKGSIAAMLVATERLVESGAQLHGSLAWLLTADEEGPSIDGTVKVIAHLNARGERIHQCIVGEPSSDKMPGDVVRNGRRGSLNGKLIVRGVQGHVAYPHLVKNPIHLALPALYKLASTTWDAGNEFFPPTSFQISNFQAGTGATNVVPGRAEVLFNFRYSTASTAPQLRRQVETVLRAHDLDFNIEWTLSGEPFLTSAGALMAATREVLTQRNGVAPVFSTGGGTSDGRFIAPGGAEVIELGPCNATIHAIDERVTLAELEAFTDIYEALLLRLLCK